MFPLLKKVYNFYCHECCWPYALSFALTPVIYWLDFIVERNRTPWASFIAYAVILSYYIYNLYLYAGAKMNPRPDTFFIKFLSVKILILGLLLLYLSWRVSYA